MSIRSQKRRAQKRLALRRFGELVRSGGRIAAHPDTIASMLRGMPVSLDAPLRGIELIPSPYIPRGQLIAMGPPPRFDPIPPITDFMAVLGPTPRGLTWVR